MPGWALACAAKLAVGGNVRVSLKSASIDCVGVDIAFAIGVDLASTFVGGTICDGGWK